MEPTAPENWRSEAAALQRNADSAMDSNERTGASSVRRMSDGGPVPFNRTRSFKTKQLVRSQAIRESQSPPRMPSPRPPGKTEPADKNKMPSVKKKSLSVDSDERTSDDFQLELCPDKIPVILKKTEGPKSGVGPVASSKQCDDNSGAKTECCCEDNIYTSQKISSQSESESQVLDKAIDSQDVKTLKSGTSNSSGLKQNNKDNINNETGIKNNDCCDFSNSNINSGPSKNIINVLNKKSSNVISNLETEATVNHQAPSQYTMHKAKYNNSCNNNLIKPEHQGVKSELENKRSSRISLADTKKQNSFNKSHDKDDSIVSRKSMNQLIRGNGARVEFQQVEIQVTSGDFDTNSTNTTNISERDNFINSMRGNRRCDCTSLDEDEEKETNADTNNWKGRRATCPSKQDSGICCWEHCQCCGDLSPDSNASMDAEDDSLRPRRQKQHSMEHDVYHQSIDNCRCQDRVDRWSHRRSGSTLTVQRASSGGNPRLLRKQSSGGSMDSGQHSITSPFLSRDNSTEMMTSSYEPMDLNRFVKETLNKSYKDRINLLKIEHELVSLIKDSNRQEHRFPQSSSYGRLLIHRCAELFGMKHGVDATKQYVYVAKPPLGGLPCRIPAICPFQQWCVEKFLTSPTTFCEEQQPPAKSILKRDAHSLDEEGATLQASRPTLRSKSFEQREEEYSKARQRIFNSSGQAQQWDWEEKKGNELDVEHCRPQLFLPENDRMSRSSRLMKVQSLENQETVRVVRGVVSKAHSFGGYGDRPNVTQQDSVISTHSAPPTRVLSQKGELASSNWRLSPGNSSGYRTLSARSDSITPSPTPNCGDAMPATGGVLWAITDMSSVPAGAVIIHPQTGQPLTNSDGSLYYHDPANPFSQNFLDVNQIIPESIRVLSNPERRRSRLEKQRATLSPANDTDLIVDKSTENVQQSMADDTPNVPEQTSLKEESFTNTDVEANDVSHACLCRECEVLNANVNESTATVDTSESNPISEMVQMKNDQYKEVNYEPNPNTNIQENIANNEGPSSNVGTVPETNSNQNVELNINIETTKILEQVVAAEYYVPSENCIYGSGYENVPEIAADPNLLEQSLHMENVAAELQGAQNSIKATKVEYSEENLPRDDRIIPYRRENNEYGVMCEVYPPADGQEYYNETGLQQGHTGYTGVEYEDPSSEIPAYPGCCAPVVFRAPPTGSVYTPQPYGLSLPLPPPFVPAPTSILPPPTVPHAPPPPPPPPPQPHIFQGWGWPTMVYAPQTTLPHPPVGDLPKVHTLTGTSYTPQCDVNIQTGSNMQQAFYQHGQTATVLMTQPPPCFPFPQQPSGFIPLSHTQQPLYQPYPLYQYPIPGRSPVLSHEGSATPGYTAYDNHNPVFTNLTQQQFVRTQEDGQRVWNNNSKSPKSILSREHSHSGSSRATPLMNVHQLSAGGVPLESYPQMEQTAMNMIHQSPYYTVQPYRYVLAEQLNCTINNGSKYINFEENKEKSYENKNYHFNNHKKNIASNDINVERIENSNSFNHGENKSTERQQKILQTKSLDSYSNSENKMNTDNVNDKRKLFKNSSVNILSPQNSIERGNFKTSTDKASQQIVAQNITENQYHKYNNVRFNKTLKAPETDSPLQAAHDQVEGNKFSVDTKNGQTQSNAPQSSEINNDIPYVQEIKQVGHAGLSSIQKDTPELAKIKAVLQEVEKAELAKNMRENNIKSYLNFPKPRQGNYYKQNHYRHFEKDNKEPRKYTNKDHIANFTPNVQGSTSAWVYKGPDSLHYGKNSTTTIPSSAPPNAYTASNTYGQKLVSNNHSNSGTKPYNKLNTKKDQNKEVYIAQNVTPTTSQDSIQNSQQPQPSTASTNNAFNKSAQRSNSYSQNINAQNTHTGIDPNNIVRTQLIQTLGGVSLMQTPPQPGFYLRQFPGWLRRPPGPSIFGSPPLNTPHLRASRPPRPFTHHTSYRQR